MAGGGPSALRMSQVRPHVPYQVDGVEYLDTTGAPPSMLPLLVRDGEESPPGAALWRQRP